MSSDSGPVLLPGEWLAPIKELVALYEKYGSVPRAIFGLISLYIADSVLSLGSFAVGVVLSVWDFVTRSIDSARLLLVGLFGGVGGTLLGVAELVVDEVAVAVASLGPFGPPLAVATGALTLYATYRLLIALLGELPGGSSVVDLLGVR